MDTTLLELFGQPTLAEEWVERTKYNVIPWVEKKGKSYWDFVRFYGHYKIGVLKELSRSQFSHLLYSTCKEQLDPKDSESSLKYNMDVFPYKDDLKKRTREELKKQPEKKWRFDFLADSHLCNKLLEELDSEYNKPLPQKDRSTYEEIKDKMKAYLVKIADEQRFAKVFDSPTYGRYTPMSSIEVYANRGFMDSRDPTYIRSFEYVDGKVDDSKVNELFSRYSSDSRIKLYIVSVQGFDLRTQLVAKDHHISLVLLNPNYEITDDSFITPRSVAICEIEQRNLQYDQGTLILRSDIFYQSAKLESPGQSGCDDKGISLSNKLARHSEACAVSSCRSYAWHTLRWPVSQPCRSLHVGYLQSA